MAQFILLLGGSSGSSSSGSTKQKNDAARKKARRKKNRREANLPVCPQCGGRFDNGDEDDEAEWDEAPSSSTTQDASDTRDSHTTSDTPRPSIEAKVKETLEQKKQRRHNARFCTDECRIKWEAQKTTEMMRVSCAATCVYTACKSGLPASLGGRFCSAFCMGQHQRIANEKNQALAKRNKKIKDAAVKRLDVRQELDETDEAYQKRMDECVMACPVTKKQLEEAIREVDKLVFKAPTYRAPIEDASDLFGVASVVPRAPNKSPVNTNDGGGATLRK